MTVRWGRQYHHPGLMISLMITVITVSTRVLSQQQSNTNYYDQSETDEPLFQDGSSSPEPKVPKFLPPPSEPLDITADTRVPDSNLAWEIKFAGNPKSSYKYIPGISKPIKILKSKRSDRSESNCEPQPPPSMVNSLLGSTLKRAGVAVNHKDLNSKLRKEKDDWKLKQIKRNAGTDHLSCETTFDWLDLGGDHYPRHVRTARCDTQGCTNGLHRHQCIGQTYKLKVLKRFSQSESAVFEEPNTQLPDDLRPGWRFATVEIIHCCECSSRPLAYNVRSN